MAFSTIIPSSLLLNEAKAAAVVPLGLVTFSRKVVALFPEVDRSLAEPTIV